MGKAQGQKDSEAKEERAPAVKTKKKVKKTKKVKKATSKPVGSDDDIVAGILS